MITIKTWIRASLAVTAATVIVVAVMFVPFGGRPAAADLTNYEVVSKTETVNFLASNGYNGWLGVSCPAGKSVLGGGGYVSEGSTHLRLRVSRPGGTTAWEIAAKDAHVTSDFQASMTVYAVCGTVS